jgi:hypothetical protein
MLIELLAGPFQFVISMILDSYDDCVTSLPSKVPSGNSVWVYILSSVSLFFSFHWSFSTVILFAG